MTKTLSEGMLGKKDSLTMLPLFSIVFFLHFLTKKRKNITSTTNTEVTNREKSFMFVCTELYYTKYVNFTWFVSLLCSNELSVGTKRLFP